MAAMTFSSYSSRSRTVAETSRVPYRQIITDVEAPLQKGMSEQTLRAHQNALFARQLLRAWQLPFYRRLWGEAGIVPLAVGNLVWDEGSHLQSVT